MKRFNFLTLLSVGVIALTSCQKQPVASFTTDKETYEAGETVELTSTSVDGDSYKWTLPDGQTSNAKDVDYTTSIDNATGTLTFKLEVFSKNGKKTDDVSKTVTITAKPTKLELTIRNSVGNIVVGALVELYDSKANFDTGLTPIATKTTDATGKVTFSDLKGIKYYWYANYDSQDNETGAVTTADPLTEHVTNTVNVIILPYTKK